MNPILKIEAPPGDDGGRSNFNPSLLLVPGMKLRLRGQQGWCVVVLQHLTTVGQGIMAHPVGHANVPAAESFVAPSRSFLKAFTRGLAVRLSGLSGAACVTGAGWVDGWAASPAQAGTAIRANKSSKTFFSLRYSLHGWLINTTVSPGLLRKSCLPDYPRSRAGQDGSASHQVILLRRPIFLNKAPRMLFGGM